jgi:hypothetical protein
MLAYSVRGDIREIEKHLSASARDHIPFATALALTRTAQFVEQKIKEEIPRAFDRPTRFTLNSTWVRPATKQRLWAEVKIKDESFKAKAPIEWLRAQIYGGSRPMKRFEDRLIAAGRMPPGHYAVPASGATYDAFGNMSRGEIVKLMSDLQSHFDPLQNTTATSAGRRRRSRTKRAQFYFSTWPVNKRTAHLRPGIYRRSEFGFGSSIRPVLIFVKRARYRKRFKFFEIADAVAPMRFPLEVSLAMRQALMTARPTRMAA